MAPAITLLSAFAPPSYTIPAPAIAVRWREEVSRACLVARSIDDALGCVPTP